MTWKALGVGALGHRKILLKAPQESGRRGAAADSTRPPLPPRAAELFQNVSAPPHRPQPHRFRPGVAAPGATMGGATSHGPETVPVPSAEVCPSRCLRASGCRGSSTRRRSSPKGSHNPPPSVRSCPPPHRVVETHAIVPGNAAPPKRKRATFLRQLPDDQHHLPRPSSALGRAISWCSRSMPKRKLTFQGRPADEQPPANAPWSTRSSLAKKKERGRSTGASQAHRHDRNVEDRAAGDARHAHGHDTICSWPHGRHGRCRVFGTGFGFGNGSGKRQWAVGGWRRGRVS